MEGRGVMSFSKAVREYKTQGGGLGRPGRGTPPWKQQTVECLLLGLRVYVCVFENADWPRGSQHPRRRKVC